MSEGPLKIAVVGKGGVGKSVITTLFAKVISQHFNFKLLLIDADPTHPHLCNMVKLTPNRSLEQIRLQAVRNAQKKSKNKQELAEDIDFAVYEGLAENKAFCMFSIGQPEGPGCFCPSNLLLRKVIESISKDFDIILIDCEAGLEQINRMVLKSVDIVILITDISLRSLETAKSIREKAKMFTNYKKLGIIINKVRGNIDFIVNKLEEYNLPFFGEIPDDQNITRFDLIGTALIEIPEDSDSYKAVKKIVRNII